MINTEDFKKPLGTLLAETFGVSEEPAAFFLDTGRSGLLGTIDDLSAETASAALRPEHETIASHCGHVLFLLRLFDAYEQGQTPEPDWEGSWSTRVVDEVGWSDLRGELRSAYESVVARLRARDAWPEPAVAASMTLLAHCAYHVGVIHKLRTSVSS